MTTGATPDSIQFHYDIGNDFYRALLGRCMVYSAGLFETDAPASLEEAQIAKLKLHLQWAGLKDNSSLLDIGCGWGESFRVTDDAYKGVKKTGLTLSNEQREYIIRNGKGDVHLVDWRTFNPKEKYDSIISIGAMEHFVEPGLSPHKKIDEYRRFFNKCSSMLSDGGGVSLQTIVYGSITEDRQSAFLRDEVFPRSELPELHEIFEALKGIFRVQQYIDGTDDYRRTIDLWLGNLKGNKPALVEKYGLATYQKFNRYLKLSQYGFIKNHTNLARLRLSRI